MTNDYDQHCRDWVAYRWRQYFVRQAVREMSDTWARAFGKQNWMNWLPVTSSLR